LCISLRSLRPPRFKQARSEKQEARGMFLPGYCVFLCFLRVLRGLFRKIAGKPIILPLPHQHDFLFLFIAIPTQMQGAMEDHPVQFGFDTGTQGPGIVFYPVNADINFANGGRAGRQGRM
jgi:hypothetical protein